MSKFKDLVFAKTSPIRSFFMTKNERIGLVFAKTGSINSGTEHRAGGGGVSIREQRSRARSRRGGVSENWIAGSAAARLFFLTAIAIAIATRPFKFHENSVLYTSSSFVSSIHSLAYTVAVSYWVCHALSIAYMSLVRCAMLCFFASCSVLWHTLSYAKFVT